LFIDEVRQARFTAKLPWRWTPSMAQEWLEAVKSEEVEILSPPKHSKQGWLFRAYPPTSAGDGDTTEGTNSDDAPAMLFSTEDVDGQPLEVLVRRWEPAKRPEEKTKPLSLARNSKWLDYKQDQSETRDGRVREREHNGPGGTGR
jgi:hypothetical protein